MDTFLLLIRKVLAGILEFFDAHTISYTLNNILLSLKQKLLIN